MKLADITSEIMLCFQIVLFSFVLCRIWFVRFSLETTTVFFSFFNVLPNSDGWSNFRTSPCQRKKLYQIWLLKCLLFRHKMIFFCFNSSEIHMDESFSVIPWCLLRVGLLSSFLPHIQRRQKKCLRALSCQTDGGSPDLSLISGDVRLSLRIVWLACWMVLQIAVQVDERSSTLRQWP